MVQKHKMIILPLQNELIGSSPFHLKWKESVSLKSINKWSQFITRGASDSIGSVAF
jgi:hypothetical protein